MSMVNPRKKHRNTTAGLATKFGQAGEICVDTTKNTAVIMDGVTQGGFPVAKENSEYTKCENDDYIPLNIGTITPDFDLPDTNDELGLRAWMKKISSVLKAHISTYATGTCSTAGATAEKAVSLSGYALINNARFKTTFDNKNTVTGPHLYIPFTGGTAEDPIGVYTLTTFGSPTYTGDKYNSNGNSGLGYNITSMGSGAWCVQCKFKSTNTTTAQQIMCSNIHFGFSVSKFTDNKFVLNLSGNGTAWSIVGGLSGSKNDWDVNTEYYLRIRFTGSAYYVDWSLDGLSWTNEITHNSSTQIYSNIGGLRFGIYYDNSTPVIGTLDDLYVSIGNSTIIDYLKLNVNSKGAKYICHANGTKINPANPAYFVAGCPIEFWYDGTNFRFKRESYKPYYSSSNWYVLWNDGFASLLTLV
jgi:hypothetical protein